MPNKQNWFEVKAQAGTRAQVFIYGVIVDYKWDEDDVTAREFIDAIRPLGDFDLRINSPGGSVPAGSAIYNALRRHKGQVDVYIEGIAASMASVVAMGGNRVIVAANALLMIHDPWSFVAGNAAEMRKAADTLDKFKVGMVAAYKDKAGMEQAEIERLMSEETWFTAQEALALGFADEIEAPMEMAAHFDLSRYKNVPTALLTQMPPLVAKSKGAPPMLTIEALRKDHPDLHAQIITEARAGMLTAEDSAAAVTTAVAAEQARCLALASATLGETTGQKFGAILTANLSPETISALGLTIAPAASADQAMLEALTQAAPTALRAADGRLGADDAARKTVASAIAAGGSVK